MEQISNEIKKVLKAGIGAVATGVEKTQEAIETLARKGEPLYEQAKTAVVDAADKVKKAVADSGIADAFSCPSRVDSVIRTLQQMIQQELDQVNAAIQDIYPTRPRQENAENADAADKPAENTDASADEADTPDKEAEQPQQPDEPAHNPPPEEKA